MRNYPSVRPATQLFLEQMTALMSEKGREYITRTDYHSVPKQVMSNARPDLAERLRLTCIIATCVM